MKRSRKRPELSKTDLFDEFTEEILGKMIQIIKDSKNYKKWAKKKKLKT